MRQWKELPIEMQNHKVKKYYEHLAKKRFAMGVKRIGDLFGALILTAVLSPVMAVIAVWIKLDSRGPVFYRQVRVTRYGQPYRIFKFRTMITGADKKGPLVTQSSDSRITGAGRALRKCRLDELPQLFNVIKGEMSFVGTRPEVKKYVDCYSDEMMATLLMPAGITSYTSIVFKDEDELIERYQKETGKSVDEIYVEYILPQKMKHNLEYLKKFSILGDLKVMIDTVFAVLR